MEMSGQPDEYRLRWWKLMLGFLAFLVRMAVDVLIKGNGRVL
jgi:hypothetical protein